MKINKEKSFQVETNDVADSFLKAVEDIAFILEFVTSKGR